MADGEGLRSVRDQLAARGLIVPRGRRRRHSFLGGSDDTVPRLRQVLEGQGPLFAAFGHYLSSRVDWLPIRDCQELGRISVATETTPIDRVGAILAADLPAPVDDVFSSFEERPLRRTLIHQWHRGTLGDGTPVIVKLIRPDSVERVHSELTLLPVLEEMRFVPPPWDILDLREVVEQFLAWLDRQLDLGLEAELLSDLSEEVDHFDALVVPDVYDELCSTRMLVVEDLEGTPLERMIEDSAASGEHRGELARRLILAWLQQSLLTSHCMEGPLASNLTVLEDDRFAVNGGLLTELDALWRRNILEAVAATASEDPDRACACLLKECTPEPEDDQRNELRNQFRQAESFRSGGWTERFTGRRLADTLFVQWRLMTAEGIRPKPHLLSFMRGLYELETISRVLAPDRDALAEAVDDLRIVAAAVEVREQLGPTRMARQIEQYVPVLRELVTKADELARDVRHGRVRLRLERTSDDDTRSNHRAEWPTFAGALFVLMAVAMVAVEVVRAHPDSAWVEPGAVAVFVTMSAMLFWIVWRTARH
jgi:ubiquinone biosynthesis protein